MAQYHHEYPFCNTHLKFLPPSALEEIADILDVPNGRISLELFAENINRLHENKLGLDALKLQAYRYQYGQRPTKLLFQYLQSSEVTIGQVQYVLDKMEAATRHIFRKYHDDIVQMVRYDMTHPSTSAVPASEHHCSCRGCRVGNEPYPVVFNPGCHRSPNPPNRRSSPNNRILPGQRHDNFRHSEADFYPNAGYLVQNVQPEHREMQHNWIQPSECGCDCGQTNCEECENRRLLDPDETSVLPVYLGEQDRNQPVIVQRTNNLSSRATEHVFMHGEMNVNDDVQTNHVSYSENPSNSFSLRGMPDGNSYSQSSFRKSLITSQKSYYSSDRSELKCTCRKPPVCTCKKEKVQLCKQISNPSNSSSGDNSNRWSSVSDPSDDILYTREYKTSRHSVTSNSDPNLSQNSGDRKRTIESGKCILISYTDDVKTEVINLAEEIKLQGHKVNTDIHKESYFSAKSQGLVNEEDQYVWLFNKYKNATYVIVCTSKGYLEAINMDQACPSPHYLNAKYIYNLMVEDPRKHEKTIEVCFEKTWYASRHRPCLPFAKAFILPKCMPFLSEHLGK